MLVSFSITHQLSVLHRAWLDLAQTQLVGRIESMPGNRGISAPEILAREQLMTATFVLIRDL